MNKMDFGLGLLAYHGCWDDAVFAEEHGFATVNVVDTPLLCGELYVNLALIADRTSSIRIGALLTIPSNRIAPITAQGISTINRIAPGRVFMGIGTGYTSRNTLGLPAYPAKGMAEYVKQCRALMDGQQAPFREGERERWVRFGQRENESVNIADRIPIYVGGDGPKALRAVGETGEGWVATMLRANLMEPMAIDVYNESYDLVKESAAEAGRSTDGFYNIISTALCVLEPGERPTDPRPMERVGAMGMLPFHTVADNPKVLDQLPPFMQERWPIFKEKVLDRIDLPDDRKYQEYHRGHLSYLREGEAEVLTDEIIRATTITGTLEEVVDQIEKLAAAGCSNITVWTPPQKTREYVLEIEERVLPALAAA